MKIKRLQDIFFNWQVTPGTKEDLQSAQVIFTHASDLLQDGTAGNANTLIAEHANWLHDRFSLPIIAQPEILIGKPDLPVIATVTQNNLYKTCVEYKKICDQRDFKNILVVTFPERMWLVCEIYKKLDLNPIPVVMRGNSHIYYHPKSKCWQFRSRFRFQYFFEIPTRLAYLKRCWI